MRILIVSSSYPPGGWGGAEVAAEGIATWMSAHGHTVAVFTGSGAPAETRGSIQRYVQRDRLFFHKADQHSRQGAARKALWHLAEHLPGRGLGEFSAIVEDFRPDLVMIHLAPGLGLGVFECCARRDLPVVYVMHDFWLTCLRSSMFSKAGASCSRREWACRWSSSARWGALSKVRRLGVWAPSSKVIERVKSHMGEVFPRVLVEHNIVDFADFMSTSPRPTDGPVRFLYVGKVTAAKGVPFLLECLSRLPETAAFEIDILGAGDAEPSLRQKYSRDPRIRFRGLCDRKTVIGFYRGATMLLMPSIWFEPAGLVIYQAQTAGIPVIGSDSGGVPDLLAGRDDSIVLAAGDSAAWTSKLAEVVGNAELRRALSAAAVRNASDSANVLDARAQRVVAFCESIVQEAAAPLECLK